MHLQGKYNQSSILINIPQKTKICLSQTRCATRRKRIEEEDRAKLRMGEDEEEDDQRIGEGGLSFVEPENNLREDEEE